MRGPAYVWYVYGNTLRRLHTYMESRAYASGTTVSGTMVSLAPRPERLRPHASQLALINYAQPAILGLDACNAYPYTSLPARTHVHTNTVNQHRHIHPHARARGTCAFAREALRPCPCSLRSAGQKQEEGGFQDVKMSLVPETPFFLFLLWALPRGGGLRTRPGRRRNGACLWSRSSWTS